MTSLTGIARPFQTRGTLFRRRAERVLPQYYTPEYHPYWPLAAIALFLIGVVLAMFTGLFVAVGGTLALKFVGFPIAIFTILILWLLPDVDRPARAAPAKLTLAYLAMIVLWPSYIAIVIPGLPWMTPPRLILFALLFIMIINIPQYREIRERIWSVLGHDKWVVRLYMAFLAISVLVLPLAPSMLDSSIYMVKQEVLTFVPVVAVAWMVAEPGKTMTVIRLIVAVAIATLAIAVLENQMQVPPWANYIPSFLQIDPKELAGIFSPQARAGDNRYRIRSTFRVVLYFTLYLNIVFPFVIFAVWQMRKRYSYIALAAIALMLHATWYANARTAFIGLFMSFFGITGLAIYRTLFVRSGGDHFRKILMVGGLATIILMVGGAIASSHRLQMYTFGGGQHAASNDTRERQWANTWRQLARNPIGAASGSSPALVGIYTSRAPNPIVDSLWINQLVEVGYIGFAIFFGFFLRLAWIGIRTFMRSENDEEDWAGPMAISLINFFICTSVVSFNDNNYLAIVVGVLILVLARQQETRLASGAASEFSAPTPGTALAAR